MGPSRRRRNPVLFAGMSFKSIASALRGTTSSSPTTPDTPALQNHDRVPALDGLLGLAVTPKAEGCQSTGG